MNTGSAYQPGDRVVFGGFGKPDPGNLQPGTEGTVTGSGHNSIQGNWASVKWDNGSHLHMLLDEGDRISRARG
jgi:hypothetical protein